jgi:hypothetical protein
MNSCGEKVIDPGTRRRACLPVFVTWLVGLATSAVMKMTRNVRFVTESSYCHLHFVPRPGDIFALDKTRAANHCLQLPSCMLNI